MIASADIAKLPGVRRLGVVSPRMDQMRPRQERPSLIELAAASDQVEFATQAIQTRAARMREERSIRSGRDIAGFLRYTRNLAIGVAALSGNGADAAVAISSQSAALGHQTEAHFTNLLADQAGMPREAITDALGESKLRILTKFREEEPQDDTRLRGVIIDYETHRDPTSGLFRILARVGLHDRCDFVNVAGVDGPFEGRGDVLEVPGALDALMQDAEAIAAGMILQYAGRPPGVPGA